jgi:hypothetical protein
MALHLLRLRGVGWLALPILGLIAGCGGTVAAVDTTSSPRHPLTRTQAAAYAHAVNLRAGDLSGFTSDGSEREAPPPGPLAVQYIRCAGEISPAHRIARIESTELSAGHGRYSEIVTSAVEVWPTPAFVAANNTASDRARSRACLPRFLRLRHRQINLERHERMQIGPFTITTVPNAIPGASNSFITRLDETRLRRNGAVLFHVYRDTFGFTSGPAELELQAIGFGRAVPASTEAHALHSLLDRANAHLLPPSGR